MNERVSLSREGRIGAPSIRIDSTDTQSHTYNFRLVVPDRGNGNEVIRPSVDSPTVFERQ
jgi:hypothetical protein